MIGQEVTWQTTLRINKYAPQIEQIKCIDINNIMLRLDVGFLPDDDGEEEAAEGEV